MKMKLMSFSYLLCIHCRKRPFIKNQWH